MDLPPVGGLSRVASSLFTAVVTWVDNRRKEREAYYKAETLRRVTEASGEGAKAAIDLLQAQSGCEASKAAKA